MVEANNNSQGVNDSFFEQFGYTDEASSFLFKSKLLTVRHAESQANAFQANGALDCLLS